MPRASLMGAGSWGATPSSASAPGGGTQVGVTSTRACPKPVPGRCPCFGGWSLTGVDLASSTAIFQALQTKQRDTVLGCAGGGGQELSLWGHLGTRVPLPSPTDLDVAAGPALIFNSLLASAGLIGGDGNVLGSTRHHGGGHGAKRYPWEQPWLKQGQAGK